MLLDYFILQKRISSSYTREQVEALRRTVLQSNFLRKAIEQGLISDGEAYFFAIAKRIFTDAEK
jgi:hypothetical protein